jgi:hypothetical protein
MSFKILLLAPDVDPSWPEKIRRAVSGFVNRDEATLDLIRPAFE